MSESKRGRPRSKNMEIENPNLNPWEESIFETAPSIETIKEVINFDTSKLSEQQKNYIGVCAGLKLWTMLSMEQKRDAWMNGTANTYYSHSIYSPPNMPPLLCYKRVGKGFKNEYIINLNTMRPTKTSQNQENVPSSIINHFKSTM